jgi:hypothetical protein
LDDPHLGVRGQVREALFRLAATVEFEARLRPAAIEVLTGQSWRGQEQATLLLAALDHKPVAARLVQLLESPREEVQVAAAWGLRKLAVKETLPAILDKANRQTERRKREGVSIPIDAQVAHLCEAMGVMKYTPAEPLLRTYIPKVYAMGEMSRSSAIWALGHLHAGVPDEELAQLLYDRAAEPLSAMPPEMEGVRIASTVALGRMQAKSFTARLKNLMGPIVIPYPHSMALAWAIHELTGESFPDPKPVEIHHQAGWFLEPLD